MLHLLIFGIAALRLYWQIVRQCSSLIKLYSGLVLSTLWMNIEQRAALRSSRVVRPVVEQDYCKSAVLDLLQGVGEIA